MLFFLFFFFSSRRRHTRYWRDWSSDVCSSDLGEPGRCSATATTCVASSPCGPARPGGVMLESAAQGPPRTMAPEELLEMLTGTTRFWRGWLARSSYRGRWREMVGRSAITLKLL